MKLCPYSRERERDAERGLLKVAPIVADKLPLAVHGFAKMPYSKIRVTSRKKEEKCYI